MKFPIDNAVSPRVAALLGEAGHDAVHVRDYDMHAAEDSAILDRTVRVERVVVSSDSDFGMLLAVTRGSRPSFILFREPEIVRAEDYAGRILSSLPALHRDLVNGCVAVFRRGRIRVRSLPFADGEV